MSNTTVNAHLVDEAAPDAQATVSLHIDNMPEGGGGYVLPAATTEAIGGVRVATIADDADAAAIVAALKAAGIAQ